MQEKTILFFSPPSKLSPDSPLDYVKKTIDAQIAYNKCLINNLLFGNPQEVVEIILSQYLDFKSFSAVKTNDPDLINHFQETKKDCIKNVITDLKNYEKIKEQINLGSFDHLYLRIFINLKLSHQSLEFDLKRSELLKKCLPQKDLKRISRNIDLYIQTKSNKLPLMVELNVLANLLKILNPEISPDCTRYLNDIEVKGNSNVTLFSLNGDEVRRIDRRKAKFQSEISLDTALKDLLQHYENALQEIPSPPGDTIENFLNIFEKMKTVYQKERVLDEYLAVKKNEATPIKAEEIEKPFDKPMSNLKKKKQNSKEKKEICSSPIEKPKKSAIPENQLLESVVETIIPPEKTLESETDKTLDASQIKPSSEILNKSEISDPKETEDEKIEAIPAGIYQSYYKKKETDPEKQTANVQRNTLHLKPSHQDTYLKLFGLIPCDAISLRALVQLTLNFGTMETTGSNRCRLEIQNIYAYISAPLEDLIKPCNTATITMHGGGHHQIRSQNNDRGKTPDYLIAQFKDAFIRAGLTPVNLGLDLDSAANVLPHGH